MYIFFCIIRIYRIKVFNIKLILFWGNELYYISIFLYFQKNKWPVLDSEVDVWEVVVSEDGEEEAEEVSDVVDEEKAPGEERGQEEVFFWYLHFTHMMHKFENI